MSLRAKLEERLEDAANAQPTVRKRKDLPDEYIQKVLDVSNMLDNGDKAVIHARPLTSKGAKKPPLGDLDIISDNYGHYAVAVRALGRPELAEQWAIAYGRGQATPEGRKSPKNKAATFEENIAEAYNKIVDDGKGFLLDVSNLGPLKSGKMGGFRATNPMTKNKEGVMVEKFGPNYAGGKVGIDTDRYPIISNNYENYAIAVEAIGLDDLARAFADKYGRNYNKKVVRGAGSPKKGATSPGRKRNAAPTDRLKDMYESLTEPRYVEDADGVQFVKHKANTGELDVSDLKEDGTGSRVIYRARKGATGANVTKLGVEGLDVVSNNYPAYKLAMELLAEAYDDNVFLPYADRYLRDHKQGKGKKSPVRKTKEEKEKEKKPKGRPISKTGSVGSRSGSSSSSSSRSASASPTRSTRTVVPRRTAGRVSPTRTGRVSPTRTGRVSPTRTVVPRTSRTERVVPRTRTERARSTSAERAERAERLRNLARSRSGSRSDGLLEIPENSEI